jgi:hypothetical protein
MIAPRGARSAWLLVGSSPRRSAKVQSAGQALSRLRASPRVYLWGGALARVAAQDRLELTAQQPNAALQLAPLAGVLVALPGPEQLRADRQARLSELALGGETFGVGLEVALQVRPAALAAPGGQVAIGPPAVGGHDPLVAAEQLAGVAFMTIGGDPVDREPVAERPPIAPAGRPAAASRSDRRSGGSSGALAAPGRCRAARVRPPSAAGCDRRCRR